MGKKSHKKKKGSSEDEVEWVEKKEKKEKPMIKGPQLPPKDEILTKPESNNWLMINETDQDAFGAFGRMFEKPNEIKKKMLQDDFQKVQSERELNPFWKEGGSGMPNEDKNQNKNNQQINSNSIGDGGLAWWTRALERCQEQAKDTGRDLEDIASERYGSLDFLLNKILDAREMSQNKQSSVTQKQKFARPGEFSNQFFSQHKRPEQKSLYRNETSYRNESEKRYLKKRDSSSSSSEDDKKHKKKSSKNKQRRWSTSSSSDSSSSSSSESSSNEKRKKKKSKRKKNKKRRSESPKREKINNQVETKVEEKSKYKIEDFEPEEDLNEIGAKIIKAELLGDDELASKLKEKLEHLKRNSKPTTKTHNKDKTSKIMIATKTDRFGNEVPLTRTQMEKEPKEAKQRNINNYSKDGQKARFFNDDDKLNLKELVEREKNETTEENALMFSVMQQKNMKIDSNYFDDTETLINSNATKQLSGWSKIQALADQKTKNERLNSCELCIENAKKHLIISTSSHAYICVPESVSLVDGHCYIVPFQHFISSLMVDEDVWNEMQMFRKALVKMFNSQNLDCIFVEQFINEKNFEHMFIECIPLDRESGSMAPMYFKVSEFFNFDDFFKS